MKGDRLAPAETEQKIARRFRLLGTQGLVGIALSAIDMALWEALARSHGTSLIRLLGGIEKPIQAYGAIGYDGVDGSARVAEDWAKRGFTGIKAKIGYSTVQEDVAVIRAIRSAGGSSMSIMVDYNQCLTPAEAIQGLRVLDEEGLTWVEEPTLAHDYAGHALIAREAKYIQQCSSSLVDGSRHEVAPPMWNDASWPIRNTNDFLPGNASFAAIAAAMNSLILRLTDHRTHRRKW